VTWPDGTPIPPGQPGDPGPKVFGELEYRTDSLSCTDMGTGYGPCSEYAATLTLGTGYGPSSE
jgi:hypothetical protein